jgi:tryptophanyl-tRNA synthetase
MAADILMFNAHQIPVGRDQIQHIEMARDVAQRFNHLYGNGTDFFVLPEAVVEAEMALLPGLDGRKMSKSYDNTIPLFEGGAKALKDAIARIVTDSKLPGEPKDPEGSALVTLHDAFGTPEQNAAFRDALRQGLGWGEAKQRLFELINGELAPMRARYEALINQPAELETILMAGAAKARAEAAPLLQRLREAVGLRRMVAAPVAATVTAKADKAALAVFKQYREADGQFYFKLAAADGRVLLQSQAFAGGRDAGNWVKRLKTEGAAALGEAPVALGDGVAAEEVAQALAELIAAAAE